MKYFKHTWLVGHRDIDIYKLDKGKVYLIYSSWLDPCTEPLGDTNGGSEDMTLTYEDGVKIVEEITKYEYFLEMI